MNERWFFYCMLFLLSLFLIDVNVGDVSANGSNGSVCWNGALEEGEVCDYDIVRDNCTNHNYTGGQVVCLDDCSGYDYNGCTGEEVCGNGIIGEGEMCESGNVRNRTCVDEGYENGTLGCRDDCARYDYSECGGERSICGDDEITGREDCEDENLNNETCVSLDFDYGELSCYYNCTFNLELCVKEEVEINETDNETIEGNETINETEEQLGEIGDEEGFFEDLGKVPSKVIGYLSNTGSRGFNMSLGKWLVIFGAIFVLTVFIMWLYVFKIKKSI